MQKTPKLFEALQAEKDPEIAERVAKALAGAPGSRLIQKAREYLQTTDAAALGQVHDMLVDAAVPNLIGREMIEVVSTDQAKERFLVAAKGKARRIGEGGVVWIGGEKYSYVDVNADIELACGDKWTRGFVEDASWNVLQRQVAEVGRAIGEEETTRIYELYRDISAASLATGAELTPTNATGEMDWDDVVELWGAVKAANRTPTVLAVNPERIADLFQNVEFINANYLPASAADVKRGIIGQMTLGMTIIASSVIDRLYAFAIDKGVAARLLVRRDIMTETFDDTETGNSGVVGTERIGLGTLDAKGVARMKWTS